MPQDIAQPRSPVTSGASQPTAAPSVPRSLRTPLATTILNQAGCDDAFLDAEPCRGRALSGILQRWATSNAFMGTACGGSLMRAGAALGRIDFLEKAFVDTPEEVAALGKRGGHRALTMAAMTAQTAAAHWLLAHGAAVNDTDLFGNTALHWAVMTENTTLQRLLEDHGASAAPVNRFFAKADHYRAAFDEAPATANRMQFDVIRRDGTKTSWDRADLHRELNFHFMSRSRLTNDVPLAMAVALAQDGEALLGELPRQPLSAPNQLAVGLRDYGPPIGFGLVALQNIPKGTLVGSYAGEVEHCVTSRARRAQLGFNPYLVEPATSIKLTYLLPLGVDARTHGNLLRFANDSCVAAAATLRGKSGWYQGVPATYFYAKTAIRAGQQLSWYYGPNYWQGAGCQPRRLPQ